MPRTRIEVIATALLMLTAGAAALAYQAPPDGPTAKEGKAASTPHLRVGGRVDHHHRPAKDVVLLNAFVPGATTHSVAFFRLKAGKPSLLLRAGGDGRMTPIALDDLYKGDELDNVRAVISRKLDPTDRTHAVYWLVVYPKGITPPGLWEKEADTTYH